MIPDEVLLGILYLSSIFLAVRRYHNCFECMYIISGKAACTCLFVGDEEMGAEHSVIMPRAHTMQVGGTKGL
jgi:hypothetical protein